MALEQLVDQVLAAVAEHRKKSPSLFTLTIDWEARQELGPWRERIEGEVDRLASWGVDRSELLSVLRSEFAGHEQNVDFEGAAEILQEMAQRNLRANLVHEGMNPKDADRATKSYHLIMRLTPPNG
jgi:hypothetical protein